MPFPFNTAKFAKAVSLSSALATPGLPRQRFQSRCGLTPPGLRQHAVDPKVSPSALEGRWRTAALNPNMDAIQRAAATESYFEPMVGGKPEPVHIFSTAEARECLQDKTIVLAGDSYLKQLYVGLADILLGEPDNENMGYPVRAQIHTV